MDYSIKYARKNNLVPKFGKNWYEFLEKFSIGANDFDHIAKSLGFEDCVKLVQSYTLPEFLESKYKDDFISILKKSKTKGINSINTEIQNVLRDIKDKKIIRKKMTRQRIYEDNEAGVYGQILQSEFGGSLIDAFDEAETKSEFLDRALMLKKTYGAEYDQRMLDIAKLNNKRAPEFDAKFRPDEYVYDFLLSLNINPMTQVQRNMFESKENQKHGVYNQAGQLTSVHNNKEDAEKRLKEIKDKQKLGKSTLGINFSVKPVNEEKNHNHKVGDSVQVHHDLTHDPHDKRGEKGTVHKIDGDVLHVKFNNGQVCRYEHDAVKPIKEDVVNESIIGKTKSGKDIHSHADHESHSSFTSGDHKEASMLHNQLSLKHKGQKEDFEGKAKSQQNIVDKTGGFGDGMLANSKKHEFDKKAEDHEKMRKFHEDASLKHIHKSAEMGSYHAIKSKNK